MPRTFAEGAFVHRGVAVAVVLQGVCRTLRYWARRSPDTHAAVGLNTFEEPDGARRAFWLSSDGPRCTGVFARRTLGVGDARISFGAGARHERFERSGCANVTFGLGGRSRGYLRVLARWALVVGEAPLKRTNCR